MWLQFNCDAFFFQVCNGFTLCKGIRLGEEVRHQFIMVSHRLSLKVDWCLGFAEADEFRCNHSALVHQLVKTVLTVCSWFAKNDWASVNASVESNSVSVYTFTIALHVKLLDMRRESNQCLTVWQDSTRFNSTDVRIVEPDHS